MCTSSNPQPSDLGGGTYKIVAYKMQKKIVQGNWLCLQTLIMSSSLQTLFMLSKHDKCNGINHSN